ncbi:coth protein-domain-containing protein [Gamsiella multidivaricata]|uniref:coth protein-domain-containing protein n=1 Tax=Gamsiella multidivaricata TaxID=101098 RepID=UPI00221ECC1B|nr:coth protein-domain-containing protein [Gamsiella multidivaricata]KAI7818706.1 coth protein-domain-containing protein [Gamsiella multidivaricata]
MFGVQINGNITRLTTSTETYPLWSANVAGVNGPLEYQYVHLNKDGKVANQEKGARKLPAGAAHTPNEFFDRTTTLSSLPPLPQVYENKLQQNSPFFREGYIGTFFVEADQAQLNYLNKGGESFHPKPIKANIQYIGANDNIKIKDVMFNLSGQSAREYAKLAYQMKFPKKNRLLDLATLKFRNEETDATMIREKIYVDILNSLGVPAQQAAYVRLFLNGKAVGLFVAVEEMKAHWIKKVLHPETKKLVPGALWKMNSCCGYEGNLQWLGPTTKSYVIEDIYKNILPGKNPKDDPMKDLIQFMADLKNFDPKKTKDPIAYWNARLDLDGFLKAMAMEYLTGSWDSYWISGSNYQIYNDPVTGKWTWLPTDFDDTFGTSFDGKIESYRKIPKVNDKGFESPLAQKLIMETPEINARFEQILKDTVSYVFNPDALTPRLDAYAKMIKEDVAWDRIQPRLSKGKSEKFTVQDLSMGLTDGTKGNWGLKKWIEERAVGVQKDLGFKAASGSPTKVPYHIMNNVEDPYGVISKQNITSANLKNSIAGDENVDKDEVADKEDDITIESSRTMPVAKKVQKVTSSAETVKGKWAALGALIAAILIAV